MRTLILALLALTACVAAPFAQAGKPSRTPAPASDFTDSTTCGFPVDIHYTVNGQSAIAFDNGRVIIAGPLAAEFSANSKSLTLNISGPATVTPTADSVIITGHGVGAGPIQLPDGSVTLAYAPGSVSIDPDTGVVTLLHGTIRLDICAALAP
jgi:hypothetical protein